MIGLLFLGTAIAAPDDEIKNFMSMDHAQIEMRDDEDLCVKAAINKVIKESPAVNDGTEKRKKNAYVISKKVDVFLAVIALMFLEEMKQEIKSSERTGMSPFLLKKGAAALRSEKSEWYKRCMFADNSQIVRCFNASTYWDLSSFDECLDFYYPKPRSKP